MAFLDHRWLAVAIGGAVAVVLSLSAVFFRRKDPNA